MRGVLKTVEVAGDPRGPNTPEVGVRKPEGVIGDSFLGLPPVETQPQDERPQSSLAGEDTERVPDPIVEPLQVASTSGDPGEQTLRPSSEGPSEPPPLSPGFSDGGGGSGSAGSVVLQLLAVAVVAALFGGASGWLVGSRKSSGHATAAETSAQMATTVRGEVEALRDEVAKDKEEVKKQAEILGTAAVTATQQALASQEAAAKAQAANKAAAGHLAEVRQVAKAVSSDAKRAADAAASTEKIARNLNIDSFRETLRAEMTKFRAEMQANLGTDGNHGNFKEELAKLRNDFREEIIKDRATYLKAAEGMSIKVAKYEVRRFASMTKDEKREALRGGQ